MRRDRRPARILLAALAILSGPAAQQPLDEAPHLAHAKDGSVIARWIRGGKVGTKRFAAGAPIELPRFATLLGKSFKIERHRRDPIVYEMPEKLFVVSDVEGEYVHLRRMLEVNGVIDKHGAWSYGKGHLVCIGDMVDRGTQVTEVLWLLYRLDREARAAGGRLHYVLGNHEVMWMGNDVRYAASKYAQVAKALHTTVSGLVGPDTELGRWLRAQSSIARVGDLLFVHAGLSRVVVEKFDTPADMDACMAKAIGRTPDGVKDKLARALAWSRAGPLWYRGYFPRYQASFGAPPSTAELDRILRWAKAKTIVIGHTKVKAVAPMYGGRVLPIDIPWTKPKAVRAVLFEKGRIWLCDIDGRRKRFSKLDEWLGIPVPRGRTKK